MTHLTNVFNLDVISSVQFRANSCNLFQSLDEVVTEVCQCLYRVTNCGYCGCEK